MLSLQSILTLTCRRVHNEATALHQIVFAAYWERNVFRFDASLICARPKFATRRVNHMAYVVRNRRHGNLHPTTALSSCADHVKHDLANRDWSSDPSPSSPGSCHIDLGRQDYAASRRVQTIPGVRNSGALVHTRAAAVAARRTLRPPSRHLEIDTGFRLIEQMRWRTTKKGGSRLDIEFTRSEVVSTDLKTEWMSRLHFHEHERRPPMLQEHTKL